MRNPLIINMNGKLQTRQECNLDRWVEILKRLAENPAIDDYITELPDMPDIDSLSYSGMKVCPDSSGATLSHAG